MMTLFYFFLTLFIFFYMVENNYVTQVIFEGWNNQKEIIIEFNISNSNFIPTD